jgi:two-component system, NarL family, sensor kinase
VNFWGKLGGLEKKLILYTTNKYFMQQIKKLLLLIFLLCNSVIKAQQPDSLLNVLKTAKEDTAKVRLLNKIGNFYKSNKFDSALYYFEGSKKLSEKLGYQEGILSYYLNVKDPLVQKGEIEKFITLSAEGLLLAKKMGDENKQAVLYENTGLGYYYLYKLDSCIIYFKKAEIIFEKNNNKNELVKYYGNASAIYGESKLFAKSLEYGFKALKLQEQGFGNKDDLSYVYSSIYITYLDLKLVDSAIIYANKTLQQCRIDKNKALEHMTLGNMMNIKIDQQKYKDLFPLLERLKEISKEIDNPENNANLNIRNSVANYYNGNTKLAEEYALKALQISEPNKLSLMNKNAYIMLNKIESTLGNYALADTYGSKRDSINDLIINEATAKNIQELEKKYETQKKETEIVKLNASNKQKSTLNKILVGSAIGLVLFSLLGYRNFKNKQKVAKQQQELQKQKITELEKDKQLSAIDAMLKGQEEERSRIAKDLHDGLGGMLSGTKLSFINMKDNLVLTPENATLFDKSLSMLDNTIADLRKVAHNLMPEALVKFGLDEAVKDFCSSIQSSSALKVVYQQVGEKRKLTNTAEVFTYRIIQELVNNAIKHAGAKQIIVQLNINTHKLSITVEDDGKGFDINTIADSKGAGMDNIKYRVQYFNGTLDIVTAPGKGTSVNIELHV